MAEILVRQKERERDSSEDFDDDEAYEEEGRQEYDAAVQAGLIPDKQGGTQEQEGGWKSSVPLSEDHLRRTQESRAKREAGWKDGDPWPQDTTAAGPGGGASADATNSGAGDVEGEPDEPAHDRGTESGVGTAGEVSSPAGQEMPAEAAAGTADVTEPATDEVAGEVHQTAPDSDSATESGGQAEGDVPARAGQEVPAEAAAGQAEETKPQTEEAEQDTDETAPDPATESGGQAEGDVPARAGQEVPAEAAAGRANETKPQTEEAVKETDETAPDPGTESGQQPAADVPALAGQEMSPDVGAGPANGTEAAGGIPDFAGYPMPDPAGKPDIERDRALIEMKEAVGEQVDRVCKAAATSIDMVELAVEKAIKQMEQKVPSMDSREIADLVTSVRQFEEHFRAVKADETRRRDFRALAAARWYKWPVRGLVAAGAVALLLAGAAGQARWGLIDGFGVADVATNVWRHIVWNEHGWKIAKCMKTADDRRPKAVCSVTARVK